MYTGQYARLHSNITYVSISMGRGCSMLQLLPAARFPSSRAAPKPLRSAFRRDWDAPLDPYSAAMPSLFDERAEPARCLEAVCVRWVSLPPPAFTHWSITFRGWPKTTPTP